MRGSRLKRRDMVIERRMIQEGKPMVEHGQWNVMFSESDTTWAVVDAEYNRPRSSVDKVLMVSTW